MSSSRNDPRLSALLRADVDRYSYMLRLDGTAAVGVESAGLDAARALLMCQGLQAVVVHRLGHALWRWAPAGRAGRTVRLAGRLAHFAANRVVESTTGISIAESASIGPGFYIGHFGGVIIGQVQLGANCTVSQGVTIGRSGRRGETGAPVLGDRVWVGPGAVLAGSITVGDDAVVGANAVVTAPVPARHSALGAPARSRESAGSFEMVVYRGAAEDPARTASMLARCPDAVPAA
ncbi:hypothetical protein GTR02_21830, partial [Kineococcus sp. R8]|uniref:serine O-acetyltransferase n=1 Tax=Kineococcus siccus TaxID=2696567 RepID=UPI001412065C